MKYHRMRHYYISRKSKDSKDFGEITLAIALLGGVIAILLYISNYFNNNVIPRDADLQMTAFDLVFILLWEIPIILLFFVLKGILIYREPESQPVKIKKYSEALFNLSFIYFLLWLIAIFLTFIFVNFIYYYNIKLSNDSGIFLLYKMFLLIFLVIVGIVIWDYSIFEKILRILYDRRPLLGEFLKRNKKIFFLFTGVIVLVLITVLL